MSCPISRRARNEYEKFVTTKNQEGEKSLHYYMIDVVNNREISNSIENKTGIKHESPQIILLHNGQPQWYESHMSINSKTINEKVMEIL
jgi:bacillithiol system protein YtxJ